LKKKLKLHTIFTINMKTLFFSSYYKSILIN